MRVAVLALLLVASCAPASKQAVYIDAELVDSLEGPTATVAKAPEASRVARVVPKLQESLFEAKDKVGTGSEVLLAQHLKALQHALRAAPVVHSSALETQAKATTSSKAKDASDALDASDFERERSDLQDQVKERLRKDHERVRKDSLLQGALDTLDSANTGELDDTDPLVEEVNSIIRRRHHRLRASQFSTLQTKDDSDVNPVGPASTPQYPSVRRRFGPIYNPQALLWGRDAPSDPAQQPLNDYRDAMYSSKPAGWNMLGEFYKGKAKAYFQAKQHVGPSYPLYADMTENPNWGPNTATSSTTLARSDGSPYPIDMGHFDSYPAPAGGR